MSELILPHEERLATQPMEIVLIRHGESEANRVQQGEKKGLISAIAAEVYARHDFQHHLTAKGVRQAKIARQVLIDMGITPETYFDERYVSPFVRTIETFAYLTDGNADAQPDVRLIERDWGQYGRTPYKKRLKLFAETERLRKISPFYTRYDNGQNFPDIIGAVRDWTTSTNREQTNKKIMAVLHGEKMWGARFNYEGMAPWEWEEMDKDKSVRIGNLGILMYSRMNPENPEEISRTVSGGWRRMIDPIEPEKSPYGGEWHRLKGRTRLVGSEILAAAEAYERLPDEEIPDLSAAEEQATREQNPIQKAWATIHPLLQRGR